MDRTPKQNDIYERTAFEPIVTKNVKLKLDLSSPQFLSMGLPQGDLGNQSPMISQQNNGSMSNRNSRNSHISRPTFRTDQFHTPILRGQRLHRVTFRDQVKGIKQPLAETIIVENWSKYNTDEKRCTCWGKKCSIF